MDKYIINKILSNNVVLVDNNNKKYILVGKGIGFGKKKGSELNNNDVIEEKFVSLEALNDSEYHTLITKIDPKIIEVCDEIISIANKELDEDLDSKISLALIDHISFAIKRIKDNIEIVNPFLNETKILYPIEYKIAKKGIEILKNRLSINIPDAEIGFIALHIYGSRKNKTKSEALEITKLINKIVFFTEKKLNLNINKESFSYNRFIMHLRGVIDRVKNNKNIENILLSRIKQEFLIEFNVALQIASIIKSELKYDVPDSEVGFITLHLFKLKSENLI